MLPSPDALNTLVFICYVYSHKKLIRQIKVYIWIGRHNINQKMFPASKRISFFSSMSSCLISVARDQGLDFDTPGSEDEDEMLKRAIAMSLEVQMESEVVKEEDKS